MSRPRLPLAAALLALLAVAPAAAARPAAEAAARAKPPAQVESQPGVRHLRFRFGPVRVRPGQNTIVFKETRQRPKVDGFVTSFRPNLVRADGKAPPTDVIHLHHAVWLVNLRPTWAAGEEKTAVRLPRGFGWRYRTTDRWILNHMIHNLTPGTDRVWITWEMDFVPASSPAARHIHAVDTDWVDAMSGKAYPVFDAIQGSGANGRFTFPDQTAGPAYPDSAIPRNQLVVTHDATLVGTAGHLHPGGLYTDLDLTRDGRTVRLFRSRAHYFEPAGPVSWDVSMTATPPSWRVRVRRGDVLSVHGTYDTARASWYEAMAIMPVAITRRPVGGADPFTTRVDVPGVLTHGHLPENADHGGGRGPYADPAALPDGPRATEVDVGGFLYGQGDLSLPDARRLPPVVAAGQSLDFVNRDASRDIFHTITGCRVPCTAQTGIAFPLANGPAFDSGELGTGPVGFTAASNRLSWQTPADLAPGTYAYFCRVHPFMRGAFRVAGA